MWKGFDYLLKFINALKRGINLSSLESETSAAEIKSRFKKSLLSNSRGDCNSFLLGTPNNPHLASVPEITTAPPLSEAPPDGYQSGGDRPPISQIQARQIDSGGDERGWHLYFSGEKSYNEKAATIFLTTFIFSIPSPPPPPHIWISVLKTNFSCHNAPEGMKLCGVNKIIIVNTFVFHSLHPIITH